MSDGATPLVSVVMPVRNGLPYIREALESIFNQGLRDLEVIVVDDGSTDGTPEWVASVGDPRLSLVRMEKPGGFLLARQLAYGRVRGRFVAHLDADDVCLPGRLAAQLEFLESHPEFVAVGTQVAYLAAGRTYPAFPYPVGPAEVMAAFRHGRPGLCDSSCMMRVELARRVRAVVVGAGGSQDFWLRAAEHGLLGNLNKVLTLVRIHESSLSTTRVQEQIRNVRFALLADRCRRQGIPEPSYDHWLELWARRSMLRRVLDEMRAMHQVNFRRALIARARGRRLEFFCRLWASAVLWPPAPIYHARRGLGHLLRIVGKGSVANL